MRVRSITVDPDRVDVVVTIDATAPVRTSTVAGIGRRALDVLPGLADHRCINDDAVSFADELADTEIPHVFEHVALELMALAGSPRDLRGETSWDFKSHGRGVFHVRLEYDDDLVCLGAVKAAQEVMRHLTDAGPRPDIAAISDALASLRHRGV